MGKERKGGIKNEGEGVKDGKMLLYRVQLLTIHPSTAEFISSFLFVVVLDTLRRKQLEMVVERGAPDHSLSDRTVSGRRTEKSNPECISPFRRSVKYS